MANMTMYKNEFRVYGTAAMIQWSMIFDVLISRNILHDVHVYDYHGNQFCQRRTDSRKKLTAYSEILSL